MPPRDRRALAGALLHVGRDLVERFVLRRADADGYRERLRHASDLLLLTVLAWRFPEAIQPVEEGLAGQVAATFVRVLDPEQISIVARVLDVEGQLAFAELVKFHSERDLARAANTNSSGGSPHAAA